VVLLRWPGLGPLLLIPISFYAPLAIGAGSSQSEINAAMLMTAGLAALWLAGLVMPSQRETFRLARPQIALLVMAAVWVLALVVGQGHWLPLAGKAPFPAQAGALALLFLSIAIFFVAADQIPDERWLKALVGLFLGLGAIFAVGTMFPPLVRPLVGLYEPGAVSSQFWTWLVALAFGQAIYNRKMHPALRLALAGLALAAIYSVYTNVPGWKSGWVPATVVVMTIILFRSIWTFLAVAGGLLVFAPQLARQLLAADEYSYSTRVLAFQVLTEIIKANWVLGLGPANYYWYTPLFAISGYYGIQFNSHNQYVDIVAQTGLLGLLVFGWFIAEMVLLVLRLRRRAPEGFALGYTYAMIGGLAGTLASGMLGDWFLPFVYNVGFMGYRSSLYGWLFLGGLLALSRIVEARR